MTFKNLQCSWICQGKRSPGKRVPVERPRSRCVEADRSCQDARAQREQEHTRGAATELSPAGIPGRGAWGTEAPQFPRPGLRHWHNCSPEGLCPPHTLPPAGGPELISETPGRPSSRASAGRTLGTAETTRPAAPSRPSDSPAHGHLHRPN